jgi:hypothetical protein
MSVDVTPDHPVAAPAAASHDPVPVATDPAWYNVTTNLTKASAGGIPSAGYGARMAFDPRLGEVVLYTGTGFGTGAPYESVTWVYNGATWTNLTTSLGPTVPSDRWYPGFDYDPAMGGVVLVGGWNPDGYGLNDTWLFTGTWENISATTGPLLTNTGAYLDYGGIGGSASAWDPAMDAFVLVDGCSNEACNLDAWSLTWVLNATGWHTFDFGPGFGSGTWLGFTSMAYDPIDGYFVLFGGWDYESEYPQNFTYTYSYSGDVAYGEHWVNISAADASCAPGCTPAGRDDDALTWDAQLGAVFMTAGYNYSYGEYNDSWEFLAGHWHALSPQPPAAFVPLEGPALAVNSTNIGVFLVGGSCPTSCSERQWVFETPPQATLTETPPTIDLGTAVTFTAGWVAGTGTGWYAGWNLSFGNGHSSVVRDAAAQNSSTAYTKAFPYTYGGAGTFTANVSWSDFFYIGSPTATVSVTVNPALVAAITASATTITTGGTVTFSTTPTGGSGTYTYAWSFGDGTLSTAESPPAHTYAKAGTYVVNLTVTDTLSGMVKDSVTITVKAPTGFSLSGSTLTYLIVGIVVLLVVVAAVVLLMRRRKKPTTTQPWQAGTPPAGAGGPPPGAGGDAPSPPPPPPS